MQAAPRTTPSAPRYESTTPVPRHTTTNTVPQESTDVAMRPRRGSDDLFDLDVGLTGIAAAVFAATAGTVRVLTRCDDGRRGVRALRSPDGRSSALIVSAIGEVDEEVMIRVEGAIPRPVLR
ncbi:hypothetical protein PHMEG_00037606 [Phytophthora megakarya]|uniref:Uncharacterized protein n=1 Tax=Phytophthora megakarya TaxID=4795 RepID=A0A225UIS1_9STRA|nr:hypothetical protein PHMEG_00037606 [Phytophthora megakarya]